MLETIDLSKKLDKRTFKKDMATQGERLRQMQKAASDAKIPVIILYEGWDAAGKGTSIEHLLDRLDPRGFKVHPISAPLEEERLRPFLWRFWTKVPARHEMAIFDRSWYGRVLVERIDKLAPKKEWKRAYREIQEFERTLVDDGVVLVKFWLQISRKEQKKRFKAMEKDRFLRYKVSDEDWKHHGQYDKYTQAVEEMLAETSTQFAPWTMVESSCLRFSRDKQVRTINEEISRALKKRGQPVPEVEDARAG